MLTEPEVKKPGLIVFSSRQRMRKALIAHGMRWGCKLVPGKDDVVAATGRTWHYRLIRNPQEADAATKGQRFAEIALDARGARPDLATLALLRLALAR